MAPKIKDDVTGMGVTQDVALDRNEWRRRTRPTPRKYGKGHQGEQGDSAVQYWKRKIGRRRTGYLASNIKIQRSIYRENQ